MPAPFRQETRGTLRRRCGMLLDPEGFKYGPVVSATPATIAVEFAKRLPNGRLKGRTLYVSGGTGAGQYSNVVDSTGGTGILSLLPSLGVTPDTTSLIELWNEGLDPERVNEALDLAVADAAPLAPVRVDLTSPTISGDRTTITLPATWTHLLDLLYKDGGGAWHQLQPSTWIDYVPDGDHYVAVVGGQLCMSYPLPSDVLGANILVRGYRLPSSLGSDSSICEVYPDFLVYDACLLIDAGRAQGSTLDPEAHESRSAAWMRAMLVARTHLGTDWEASVTRLRP